jgi:hypothetical protein
LLHSALLVHAAIRAVERRLRSCDAIGAILGPLCLIRILLALEEECHRAIRGRQPPVLCQSAPDAVGLRDFQKSFFRLEWKVRGLVVVGQEILSERSQGSARNGWGSAIRSVVTALHHVLEDHRLVEKYRGVADESDSTSRVFGGRRCRRGRGTGELWSWNCQ